MRGNFQKKVLSNGMTVLFEKRDLPVVSVAFALRAGGINESPEEKGISHFIEHMLYKGTPTRSSKEIAEDIEKNGGGLNGFTSEEVTCYWCKMPSEKLEVALDVLGDMVRNPLFDEKELDKERLVILEEIKMYSDNPRLHIFDEIQKTLYNGTLGVSLTGTFETMKSLDRKKVVEKFRQIYTPNNLILCVVGDADFDSIVDFAEKNFSGEEGEIPEQSFEAINNSCTEIREGIDQANLVFAYHVPVAGESKSFVAQILSAITAGGMSSRLFSEIREKRNLAYVIKGDANINKRFAYNLIYAGTKEENVEKIKGLILEEFEKIAKDLDEEELGEIKQQLIGHHKISMEDSQTQMVELIASEIHGDANDFYEFEKHIKSVKLEEVKEMASSVKAGNYSFFALVPSEK